MPWRVRFVVVLIFGVIAQTSLLDSFGAVRADVMLLLAICFGLQGGPERGALLGFLTGVVTDLFLQTPLGLSALTFTVVAFTVGSMQTAILRNAFWIVPVTAVVGSAAGVGLYALLGAMVGQTHFIQPALGWTIVAVGALNGLASLFIAPIVRWAVERPDTTARLRPT